MVRLKFFLFALVVLALGLAQLLLASQTFSAPAVESARVQANTGTVQVEQWVAARRSVLQGVVLGSLGFQDAREAVAGARAGKPSDAAVVAKLSSLRNQMLPLVSEADRATIVVGLATESGAVHVRGRGDAATEGLDVFALASVGVPGGLRDGFGVPHVFITLPQGSTDVVAVVGLPLFTEGVPLKPSPVVALIAGETVSVVPGADPAAVEKAKGALRGGQTDVVEVGGAAMLGPVTLPFLTRMNDFKGGQAPLSVGARQLFEGSPYEVLSLVSLRPAMGALAHYQSLSLMGLGALLLLTVVWTLVMGSSNTRARDRDDVRAPLNTTRVDHGPVSLAGPSSMGTNTSLPLAEPSPAPEPTPDDFQFGPPPPRPSEPVEPETMPFQTAAVPRDAFPSNPNLNSTAAYSLPPGMDPFAAAAAQYPDEGGGEYNAEATRVATIPQELLQASSGTGSFPNTELPSASVAPPRVSAPEAVPLPSTGGAGVQSEDAHFQDVYRDFISTRERCGEPADGLTFEKFVVKLRKNRDQLVQKYACRTVRFQVYVKEGKAALKATPVKD